MAGSASSPSRSGRADSRTYRLAAGASLALLFLVHLALVLPPKPMDDAYITYRYAANLAAGLGFVYNPGEHVLGTSSPLHTLLLAGGALLGLSIPWFAAVAEALAALAIGVLILLHFSPPESSGNSVAGDHPCGAGVPWAGVATVAILALPAHFRFIEAIAMESCLYVAGVLGVCVALRQARIGAAAALAAAVTLLRPEGFLIAIAFLVGALQTRAQWWPQRRRVAGLCLAAAAPVAAWCLFAWQRFGSPIPQSVVAKAVQFGAFPDYVRFRAAMWDTLAWRPNAYQDSVLLAWLGLVWALLRDPGGRPLWAWLVTYIAVLSASPAVFAGWYRLPVSVCLVIAMGHGLQAVHALLRRWLSPRQAVWGAALVGLIALRGEIALTIQIAPEDRSTVKRYEVVGPWLRAHTPPDSTVAAIEIGLLGFHSERPVIDLMGLVTPAVVAQLGQRPAHEICLDLLPDFHVHPVHDPLALPQRGLTPDLLERYELIHTEEYSMIQQRICETLVLRRRDFMGTRMSAGLALGDLDGDGTRDVIVGTRHPGASPAEPVREIQIHFGDGHRTAVVQPPGCSAPSFTALACGDIDGDGAQDLVLGMSDACPQGRRFAGTAWVLFGGRHLRTDVIEVPRDSAPDSRWACVLGGRALEGLGWAAACGDVDADGTADLILGAPRWSASPADRHSAGAVAVVRGGRHLRGATLPSDPAIPPVRGPAFALFPADSTASRAANVIRIRGAETGDLLGWAVATGDVDGDAIGDVICAAMGASGPLIRRPGCGEAWVLFGPLDMLDPEVRIHPQPPPSRRSTNPNSPTHHAGPERLRIVGADPHDGLGSALACGDLDGDGCADLVLGAPGGDGSAGVARGAGEVAVVFGSPALRGPTVDLRGGTQRAAVTRMFADAPFQRTGWALACATAAADKPGWVFIGAQVHSPAHSARGEIHAVEMSPALRGRDVTLGVDTALALAQTAALSSDESTWALAGERRADGAVVLHWGSDAEIPLN